MNYESRGLLTMLLLYQANQHQKLFDINNILINKIPYYVLEQGKYKCKMFFLNIDIRLENHP